MYAHGVKLTERIQVKRLSKPEVRRFVVFKLNHCTSPVLSRLVVGTIRGQFLSSV